MSGEFGPPILVGPVLVPGFMLGIVLRFVHVRFGDLLGVETPAIPCYSPKWVSFRHS